MNILGQTWQDVPEAAPTVGVWPSELSKHEGVVLAGSQLLVLPHIHRPPVGLAAVPKAVHIVLPGIIHVASLLVAQTHCASFPEPGGLHIGFKASHP